MGRSRMSARVPRDGRVPSVDELLEATNWAAQVAKARSIRDATLARRGPRPDMPRPKPWEEPEYLAFLGKRPAQPRDLPLLVLDGVDEMPADGGSPDTPCELPRRGAATSAPLAAPPRVRPSEPAAHFAQATASIRAVPLRIVSGVTGRATAAMSALRPIPSVLGARLSAVRAGPSRAASGLLSASPSSVALFRAVPAALRAGLGKASRTVAHVGSGLKSGAGTAASAVRPFFGRLADRLGSVAVAHPRLVPLAAVAIGLALPGLLVLRLLPSPAPAAVLAPELAEPPGITAVVYTAAGPDVRPPPGVPVLARPEPVPPRAPAVAEALPSPEVAIPLAALPAAPSPALPPRLAPAAADPGVELRTAPPFGTFRAAPARPEARIAFLMPDAADPADVAAAEVALSRAGLVPASRGAVGFRISATHVRYYHAVDQPAAARAAAALGGEARDFTGYRPSPPEGTVEVWLAGRSSAPSSPSAGSTDNRAPLVTLIETVLGR